jgi:hypothetical protein
VQEADRDTGRVSRRNCRGRCRNFDRMTARCCDFSQPASRTARRSS